MKKTATILIIGGIISIMVAFFSYNVKEFTDDVFLQRKLFCFSSAVVYFLLNIFVWILTKRAFNISGVKLFKIAHYVFGYASVLSLSNLFDEMADNNLVINISEVIAALLGMMYTGYIIIKELLSGKQVA